MCPEVLGQQGGVGEGAATQRALVAAVGLAVDPCLMPLQCLLPAEPSATRLTQDAALQGLGKPQHMPAINNATTYTETILLYFWI